VAQSPRTRRDDSLLDPVTIPVLSGVYPTLAEKGLVLLYLRFANQTVSQYVYNSPLAQHTHQSRLGFEGLEPRLAFGFYSAPARLANC